MQNLNTNKHTDVYSMVTNRIIEHLEKGVVPWQKPWTGGGIPKNLITGKQYRGINVWLLNSLNYSQNCFLTFKQVKELGGSVKKGEQSQIVIFWKWIEKENTQTKEIEKIPFLRYYNVFNIEQCTGIPKEKLPPIIERKNDPIEACEKIIAEMPKRPEIRHNEQSAYYNKIDDFVNMPKTETFVNSESYYGTLFHELVHSTGHKERLDRKELIQSKRFGSENYAIEELTAEIGASYLKSYAGVPIEKLENNAAYIQTWLERLKKDKKFIIHASSQAQKATDFILNVRNEEKEVDLLEENEHIVKSELRGKELDKMRGIKGCNISLYK
jgi:antirestriction protein ArdC